jgi:hypothetical protein
MTALPNTAKIVQSVQELTLKSIPGILFALKNSNLHQAEVLLHSLLPQIANAVLEPLLHQAAEAQMADDIALLKEAGGRKIVERPCRIVTSTGHAVDLQSAYAKKIPADWVGSRHSVERKWKTVSGASPRLAEQLAFASTIAPSYELGNQLVRRMGINVGTTYQRKITNAFACVCRGRSEIELLLKKGESLKGKRVVLSIDGGRTNTRVNKATKNLAGNLCYSGEWKEPTLFVIDIIDKDGNLDRQELPIYGMRFDKTEVLELLKVALKALNIEQAAEVQLVADGATWIWNHLPDLLLGLGVEKEKITETLDYYHASGHLCNLHKMLPKRLGKKVLAKKLVQYKEWLWSGKSNEIVKDFKEHCPNPKEEATTEMNYLLKHIDRTQYADYKELKLLCGSGIVESAVRRVINLRYKSNATFWDQNNVEMLFFLRGAIVSKRWNNVTSNLFAA